MKFLYFALLEQWWTQVIPSYSLRQDFCLYVSSEKSAVTQVLHIIS